jgi:hypothetical protein
MLPSSGRDVAKKVMISGTHSLLVHHDEVMSAVVDVVVVVVGAVWACG